MPYEKYVAEQVFRLAEMNSTGYPIPTSPSSDIAIGDARSGGDWLRSNRPARRNRQVP